MIIQNKYYNKYLYKNMTGMSKKRDTTPNFNQGGYRDIMNLSTPNNSNSNVMGQFGYIPKMRSSGMGEYGKFIEGDDWLFKSDCGGLKYAEESTDEDPVMIWEGYDPYDNLKHFRKKIHLNEVDPTNATKMEMLAVGLHCGIEGNLNPRNRSVHSSLSVSCRGGRTFEKSNFVELFEYDIVSQAAAGLTRHSAEYERCYNEYMKFFNAHKPSGSGAVTDCLGNLV